MAGYIPRWFTRPQTVTHPSVNWAQRRVTTLIETNVLPLRQVTTSRGWIMVRHTVLDPYSVGRYDFN